MPSAISPNFACTDMGQAEIVFGGMDRLRAKVSEAVAHRPGAVVVISSCVSGIIGDDILDIESLSTPEIPVIAIAADGNMAGDYMEGIRMCMYTLAKKLIDPSVKPSGRLVNLVHETGVSNNHTLNYQIISSLLEQMDIRINFLMNFTTSDDDIRRYSSARDLREYYQKYGLSGLEVMPLSYQDGNIWRQPRQCPIIEPDMVTGVHACCITDWMGLDRTYLLEHYRKDLDYAQAMGAEYVVFHVSQASDEELYTWQIRHTDEEVIDTSCALINELLKGGEYTFWFLMENQWWPAPM